VVTSGITFCRTIGGALGVGALGALFNVVTYHQMAHLRNLGVDPAHLFDTGAGAGASPTAIAAVRTMFTSGLTWVFAAMLAFAAAQVLVAACIRREQVANQADQAAIREATMSIAG
jgi:hypothetical protein